MKRWILVALLLLEVGAGVSSQELPVYSVGGTVLRAGTDQALGGIRVELIESAASGSKSIPTQIRSFVTTDEGRFSFSVPQGTYRLRAGSDRYPLQDYLGGSSAAPATIVIPNSKNDIVFVLLPGGVVSGRVTAIGGSSLPGLEATLFRASYNEYGERTFVAQSTSRTDDRGQYRVSGIVPGRYIVSVGSSLATLPISPVAPTVRYPTTFYPRESTPLTGSTLTVRPGEEVAGIDFVLSHDQARSVSGTIVDPTIARPPSGTVRFVLMPRDYNLVASVGSPRFVYERDSGRFQLNELFPGRYFLSVLLPTVRVLSSQSTPTQAAVDAPAAIPTATLELDITNADISGLIAKVTTGATVTVEVESDSKIGDVEGLQVEMKNVRQGLGSVVKGEIQSDRRITLKKVTQGAYYVSVKGLPPNVYVQEINLGKRQSDHNVVFIGPDPEPLRIKLSSRAGRVEGNVAKSGPSQTEVDLEVVLIPEFQRDRYELYQSVLADSKGHFEIKGVAPGDYLAFAWLGRQPYEYFDPELQQQIGRSATRVHITDTSTVKLQLTEIVLLK